MRTFRHARRRSFEEVIRYNEVCIKGNTIQSERESHQPKNAANNPDVIIKHSADPVRCSLTPTKPLTKMKKSVLISGNDNGSPYLEAGVNTWIVSIEVFLLVGVWGHLVDRERVDLLLELLDTLHEIKRVHPTISLQQAEGVDEI